MLIISSGDGETEITRIIDVKRVSVCTEKADTLVIVFNTEN